MLTVYSEHHRLHSPQYELFNGEFVAPVETPDRLDSVLRALKSASIGEIVAPISFGVEPLLRVHAQNFINYLQTAWEEWAALGRKHDVLPFVFPSRQRRVTEPGQIDGKAGFFAFDTGAPITAHTWKAIQGSADCALTAAQCLQDRERAAFALCRPPGHHAGLDLSGGYCYVNNAAVAAQRLLDQGASRIAILDVDYHHGNGTQEIFYRRSDVFFASIHAHPHEEFPYFSGYADEIGEEAGVGYNRNYPLHRGARYETEWGPVLAEACKAIAKHAPDVLVVSLGVDTFEADPISRFKLKSEDYSRMGEVIGKLGLRTLFVMEGGYAVKELGTNVANVLQGFQAIAR